MILKTSEDIKVKSGLLKISMLTVWTAIMPGLASCVQEAVVYDDAVFRVLSTVLMIPTSTMRPSEFSLITRSQALLRIGRISIMRKMPAVW